MSDTLAKPVLSDGVPQVLLTEIAGDRRSSRRYSLSLPVIIRNDSSTVGSTGRVVNISSKGILFTADKQFTSGLTLHLAVSWPAMLEGTIPMQLVIEGVVIRTDGNATAVAIVHYQFRTQRRR